MFQSKYMSLRSGDWVFFILGEKVHEQIYLAHIHVKVCFFFCSKCFVFFGMALIAWCISYAFRVNGKQKTIFSSRVDQFWMISKKLFPVPHQIWRTMVYPLENIFHYITFIKLKWNRKYFVSKPLVYFFSLLLVNLFVIIERNICIRWKIPGLLYVNNIKWSFTSLLYFCCANLFHTVN